MRYRNLDVELLNHRPLAKGGHRFDVRVRSDRVDLALAEEPSQLDHGGLARLKALDQPGAAPEEWVRAGCALRDALFPSRAREALTRARQVAAQADERIRLRVLTDAPALEALPWEACHDPARDADADPADVDGFLAFDRTLCVVRRPRLGGEAAADLTTPRPGRPRVLVVTAEPGAPRLQLEAEAEQISTTLGNHTPCVVVTCPHATRLAVLEALGRSTQIFHFAGHGGFQRRMGLQPGVVSGEGVLVMHADGEGEGTDPWPAASLGNALRGSGVWLAVLNACESGLRDDGHPFSGVAAALIRAGVPLVVAMQRRVGDQAALAFSRLFYAALARGECVEAAVSEGRLAMRATGAILDALSVALTTRTEESVLFPTQGVPAVAADAGAPGRRQAPLPPPDRHALRAYLDRTVRSFDDLDLLLAAAEARLANGPYAGPLNRDRIFGRDLPLPNALLKTVTWFEQRSLFGELVAAIGDTELGRANPL
ncbi:MAG: CHAT domain-containing protein [Thermoflexales bacterium]|nr:CHAT domain-containing protein [Thermoflexales bacterium]